MLKKHLTAGAMIEAAAVIASGIFAGTPDMHPDTVAKRSVETLKRIDEYMHADDEKSK